MENAHLASVEKLRSYAAIPVEKKYDSVIGHTGYVGVNHYQAAKGALTCLPLLKKNGICLLAACHTDPDPIGGANYKRMLRLLGRLGPEKFVDSILSPSWTFVPEQWEAQMWARLFKKIPPSNLIYCSFEIPEGSFYWIPGQDARTIVPGTTNLQELVEKSLAWAAEKIQSQSGREPQIALLLDGPYGIPIEKED